MENLKLKSFDGTELYCYLFDNVKNPKAVVMICHGMGEYIGRYFHVAEYLNKEGFIVFGDDHRGHGFSEDDKHRGHHAGDIFSDTVKDEIFILNYLKEKYNLPVLFLGHSYGSFLGQSFLEQNTDIKGVALTGSGVIGNDKTGAGMFACRCIMLFSKKMRMHLDWVNTIRDHFAYKGEKGKKLWLTRDEYFRKTSVEDKYTGVPMSVSFCYYLLKGEREALKEENVKKVNVNTPIGLFSGSMDPIGDFSKGITKLYNQYVNLGVKDIEFHLYEGARHEVLNETNRQEVMADLVKFYNKCLNK